MKVKAKGGLTGNMQTDGYYESLEPVIDGLGLESYPYGYAGYHCGYIAGEYWPSSVEPPETSSRRESTVFFLDLWSPRPSADVSRPRLKKKEEGQGQGQGEGEGARAAGHCERVQ